MVYPTARNNGITFDELNARLEAEGPTRVDAIVDTSSHVALDLLPRLLPNGKVSKHSQDVGIMFMTPDMPEIDGKLARMTDHMHAQVAARAGIDRKYYDRMRTLQPSLLMKNVETWWRAEPDSRMIRAVRPATVQDGELKMGRLTGRAWLSDQYKALDNRDFLLTVLEKANEFDARIESCYLDDERVYMKMTSPRLQTEIKKGDVLEAGVIVKNSEVGDGRVLVQPYHKRLICLNGMVSTEQYGQVHLGGQKEVGILQQDTLEAEAKSVWLQVRDWVGAVFTGHFLEKARDQYRAAEGVPVRVEARKAVANVVRNYGLTGRDGQGILDRYLRANDDSQFGLVNALTQFAHEGNNAYRRQVELEVHGGALLAFSGDRFTHMVSAPITDEQVAKAVNA